MVFDGFKFFVPREGLMSFSGVGVVAILIAEPSHLACGDDVFSEHEDFIVLPGNVSE